VLESAPQLLELQALLESAQDTDGAPESFELIMKAWPASSVTAELDRLTTPPPAYPPDPHPVNARQTVRRNINIAVV
jgi:hypothetical protein